MERVLTSAQMRAADKYTIEKLCVSEETLIDRASDALLEVIKRRFRGGRVLICAGKGNNGADGKALFKKLSLLHGFTVTLLNFSLGALKFFDKKYDIIVDCLFGTGLNREVEGVYRSVIEKINESGSFIISCDIPSGLSADTGKPLGVSVKANMTVAIQEYKLGHFINDGPDYCGEVVAKDIGISIWGEDFAFKLSPDEVKKFFPERKRNVNKGNFGKACVIGGSKDFSGSALLSYNAFCALKTGKGYSFLGIPESLFNVFALRVPEVIIKTFADNEGFICYDENALTKMLDMDAIAFGMGVGVSESIYQSISFLIKNYKGVLIIDADGLNSIAKFGLNILKNAACKVVLTPHVGEFSRLTGKSKQYIADNFVESAKAFAKEYGVIIALKSSASVITDGETVIINVKGCSGLSKGGSGDVLSGIMLGVVNKDCLTESVAAACYLFGFAAEICEKDQNAYTLTATDVINYLPKAINNL